MSDTVNISARIPVYYRWVVERLAGRKFKNKSDAVTQMMALWLTVNQEWLDKNELGISHFDNPREVRSQRGEPAQRRDRLAGRLP